MRILSLLPSATEMVFALRLGDELVAVSADCDEPAAACSKPVVSRPIVSGRAHSADEGGRSAAEVDAEVRRLVAAGEPVYELDRALLAELRPDLVLAQDLCAVCALPSSDVAAVLERRGIDVRVLSFDPRRLDDVIDDVLRLSDAAGVRGRGEALATSLRERITGVRRAVAGAPRRRVLAIEWTDPAFVAGHWVPDMIHAAGGSAALGVAGEPSRAAGGDEMGDTDAEVVVVMPCGYHLPAALDAARDALDAGGWARADEVWAVDGAALFSRPGPRVVEGVELLGAILHPAVFGPPSATHARRLR